MSGILIEDLSRIIVPDHKFVSGGTNLTGDIGAGAPWIRGTSAGIGATQDAAGTWFVLEPRDGYFNVGWLPNLSGNLYASLALIHAAAAHVEYPAGIFQQDGEIIVDCPFYMHGQGRGLTFIHSYGGDVDCFTFTTRRLTTQDPSGMLATMTFVRQGLGTRTSGRLTHFDGCSFHTIRDCYFYGGYTNTQLSDCQNIKYEKTDSWAFSYAGYYVLTASDVYFDTCLSPGWLTYLGGSPPPQPANGVNCRVERTAQSVGFQNCDFVSAPYAVKFDAIVTDAGAGYPIYVPAFCPQWIYFNTCFFAGVYVQKCLNVEFTRCWLAGGSETPNDGAIVVSGNDISFVQCSSSDSLRDGFRVTGGTRVRFDQCKLYNASLSTAPTPIYSGINADGIRNVSITACNFWNETAQYTGRQLYGILIGATVVNYIIRDCYYDLAHMTAFSSINGAATGVAADNYT